MGVNAHSQSRYGQPHHHHRQQHTVCRLLHRGRLQISRQGRQDQLELIIDSENVIDGIPEIVPTNYYYASSPYYLHTQRKEIREIIRQYSTIPSRLQRDNYPSTSDPINTPAVTGSANTVTDSRCERRSAQPPLRENLADFF